MRKTASRAPSRRSGRRTNAIARKAQRLIGDNALGRLCASAPLELMLDELGVGLVSAAGLDLARFNDREDCSQIHLTKQQRVLRPIGPSTPHPAALNAHGPGPLPWPERWR